VSFASGMMLGLPGEKNREEPGYINTEKNIISVELVKLFWGKLNF